MNILEKKKKTLRESLPKEEDTVNNVSSPEPSYPTHPSPPKPSLNVAPKVNLPSEDEAKKRAEDKKALLDIPKPENPGDLDSALKKVSEVSDSLSSKQIEGFKDRRDKIDKAIEKAEADFKRTRDIARWAEAADAIGKALVQFGAASYGLKHGVDMSGLKFEKADWSKYLAREEDALNRRLGLQDKKINQIDKDEHVAQRKKTSQSDFIKKAILKDYFTDKAAFDNQKRAAEKELANLSKQGDKESAAKKKALLKTLRDDMKAEMAKLKTYDKALAEANDDKLDTAKKTLGGLEGEKLEKDMEDSDTGWWIFGPSDKELMNSALKVKIKSAQDKINQYKSMISGDTEQAPPTEFPKTVRKDGNTATVSNAQELSEAKAEGWSE